VQVKKGNNVVLFHESAKVAEEAIPEGTEITASTGQDLGDGWEFDYSVTEIVPPSEASKTDSNEDAFLENYLHYTPPPLPDDDDRPETLRLVMASIEVHHVSRVKVITERHSVGRYRSEKRPFKY
jgi:hypothetical protein